MDKVAVGIGRTSLVPVLTKRRDAGNGPDKSQPREISGHAGLVLRALQDVMAGPECAILPPFDGLPQGDTRGVPVEACDVKSMKECLPCPGNETKSVRPIVQEFDAAACHRRAGSLGMVGLAE